MSSLARGSRSRSKPSTTSASTVPAEQNRDSRTFSTPARSRSLTPAEASSTIAPFPQASHEDISMDKEDGKLALDRVPTPTPLPSCTNGTDAQGKSVPESDDRSSSLSEIDDGPDQEELENKDEVVGEPLPENDSEAETERLENSPQKLGKLKNVVLSSSLQGDDQASGKLLQRSTFAQREVDDGEGSAEAVAVVTNNIVTGRSVGELKHSSPATTLVGSFAGSVKGSSPSGVAGKKRKRANPGNQETSDGIDDMDIARKQNSPIKSEHNDNGSSTQHFFSDQDGEECHREVDDPTASDVEAGQTDEDGTAVKNDGDKPLPTRNKKGKTGKRKGKKQLDGSPGDSAQIAEKAVDDIYGDENGQVLEIDNVDEGEGLLAADGEGEEAEAEAEAAARTEEELAKKRVAMDSLGAIEKHFAAFRDKLYDERVAQLTNELALLTQPDPTHPEYLAMVQCLDQRRDEKIQHEQILLQYKLKALEIKSVAERSQLHSQYFQTVRAVREKKLEEVGEQWYQIQRDRRGWEGSGSATDFTYKFPTRRSQQIAQQTAYNLEVSILSGVAKYVGFPAAPTVNGARSSEIDEDLQNMGIKTQLRPTMHNRNPSPLHAAFSTASFSRNRPAAEEQFLEQNAWANSQHPVHQQLHHPLQRQGSQISSSLTTPAAQRRIVDLSAPKGSASTIADESSVPTSSAVATPISIAQHQGQQKLDRRGSTKPDSLSHSAEGVPSVQGIPLASEGERSPTDLRKHHPGGHAAERPGPSESPGFLQQSSAPVSSSSFPSAFGNSNPASRQGIFSEHLGMASPSSTSSAAKVEEVPENPRPPSAMSHLQHLQGSVITAGSGMGRFGVR